MLTTITTLSAHIVRRFVGVVRGKTVLREKQLLAKVLPVMVTVYSHVSSNRYICKKGVFVDLRVGAKQLAITVTNVVPVTQHLLG